MNTPRFFFASWSQNLIWPSKYNLSCIPVTEGCETAFNLTNFIRVSHYFQTYQPIFLSLHNGFADVKGLWKDMRTRPNLDAKDTLAEFGKTRWLQREQAICSVLPKSLEKPSFRRLVLENYQENASNILEYPWPSAVTLLLGHENKGVSKETLAQAHDIAFIPQQGTISSVNLVVAYAIALYCMRVAQCAKNCFVLKLAARTAKFKSRDFAQKREERKGDLRPIRPLLYHIPYEKVVQYAREHRLRHFSIFYENSLDFRTLGGSIRNANAFGIKKVFYSGRRKINRQGSVGSYLYVDIIHLPTTDKVISVLREHEVWVLLPTYLSALHPISDSCNPPFLHLKNRLSGSEGRETTEHSLFRWQQIPTISIDDVTVLKETIVSRRKKILLILHQEGFLPPSYLLPYTTLTLRISNTEILGGTHSQGRGLPATVSAGIAMFIISQIMWSAEV